MKTLTAKQVKGLQEQKSSFGKAYLQSCKLHNVTFLPHLISSNPCHLDLDIQKINTDLEWIPVIIALKKNRELAKVVISDSKTKTGDEKRVSKILPDIMAAISDVLVFNMALTTLEITNIALRDTNSLQYLAKGLLNNTSLNYLSLRKCKIGDSGLQILSPSLRTLNHLKVLNLSGCNLTEKGATIISSFLKV
jgi:centrosomal protein CEP78